MSELTLIRAAPVGLSLKPIEFTDFLKENVGRIVEINRWEGPDFYKEEAKHTSPRQIVCSSLVLLLWYHDTCEWMEGISSPLSNLKALASPDEWNSCISLRAFSRGYGHVVKLLIDGKPVVMRVHCGDFVKHY